jgi:hypothetical protein
MGGIMGIRRLTFNEEGMVTMPSRYVCSVLDEMRTAVKVGRIDMVLGLIEEMQTLVNRMEAKLQDYSDLGYTLRRAGDLKKSIRAMEEQVREIEGKIGIQNDFNDD